MGDPVDIQNLLQAGYFNTSRTRSRSPGYNQLRGNEDRFRSERPREDTGPRYESQRPSLSPIRLPPPPRYDPNNPRNKRLPPSPTIDDENTILAKEHGYSKTAIPEEEPSSRGDVDQNPVILEVHEFNPERRFVIVDDDPTAVMSDDKTMSSIDNAEYLPKAPPRQASNRSPRRDDSSRRHRGAQNADLSPPPPISRRRSRQDLPVLETYFSDRRRAEHHRSRSVVNGPRPEYFNPSRSSRPYGGDQLLSPAVTKQSSRGREESYDDSYREKTRESRYSRISPGHSAKSSDTGPEPRMPRRTNSTDRTGERRRREYYTGSFREEPPSRPAQPSSKDSARQSARGSRDHSHSKDEYIKGPQPLSASQKPVVVQGDGELNTHRVPESEQKKLEKVPSGMKTAARENSPPRAMTMPIPPMSSRERTPVLRPAATMDSAKAPENLVQSPLPYPEEDSFQSDSFSLPRMDAKHTGGAPPPLKMPDIPPTAAAEAPVRYRPADSASQQPDSSVPEIKEWKPPSFNPEKDGSKPNRPVGLYRRYSENREEPTNGRLPSCPRVKPVSGKVDWLTLPRTDFNICPECYGQVFSNSEYRTHFQPVLRPTMDAIACDFGSSPWYRIAWLLTLKNKMEDLQVFHDIAHIATAARGQRCPGERKTTREWYTIKDPYTKRPVPEFTVCYQCARTVETLLPSLGSAFEPLDSRLSPVRGNCALHFAPDRTDFVLFFDAFETTADKAEKSKKGADMSYLAQQLERLSIHNECREDRPVTDGYWHFMQFLPDFTVCGDCFEDVVKPRLTDENIIARNFYIKPQKIMQATCQLYSPRMRDIFITACRRKDPRYLESKVRERLAIESSIKNRLSRLDREGPRDSRTDKEIDDLIEEWKEWE